MAEPQHRSAYYLMLNNALGAATGFLFWLLLARVLGLSPNQIGAGYAVVALGTMGGTIAKGGLDAAILRHVPGATRDEGARLLRLAALTGASVAILLAATGGLAARFTVAVPGLSHARWALVGLIGAALVLTWLQDAYFLAEGNARLSLQRNAVLSAARLLLPVPVVLLSLPNAVATTWVLALAVSALGAGWLGRNLGSHGGRLVPRSEFLRSAARNVTGSAAEFLPGLLLVPLVFALVGAAEAAFFAIAWTAASTLFLASAAISRSALAAMVREPSRLRVAGAIRRAVLQHAWTVVPAASLGVLLSPWLLFPFGGAYARAGAFPLAILCLSVLLVAPTYVYMAFLRATERPLALLVFPAVMILSLAALAPPLAARSGASGVAFAWLVAHVPVAAFAAWRLARLARAPLPIVGPAAARPLDPAPPASAPDPAVARAVGMGVKHLARAPSLRGGPHPE